MFTKILVATDASEASNHLVACLGDLRKIGAQHVVLAHVINVQTVGAVSETTQRHYETKLQEQSRALQPMGYTTEAKVVWGVPFVEIESLAAQTGANLIATASHGRSMVAQALLGSTAQAILHHARLPVLLFRVQIMEENGGNTCRAACTQFFTHILHPTDFSETAERAFQELEQIVRQTKCAVTLLHVQDKAKMDPHLKHRLEEFNRTDQERLERRREHLLKAGAAEVRIHVPYGSPTGLILEQARAGGYSLILMGTQGRGFLKEVFLGSVAYNVARQAPLPVLFVPALR